MRTTTSSIVSIAAIGLSLSGIAFGQGKEAFPRDRGPGKAPALIAPECDYNSGVPYDDKVEISDGVPPSLARAARKVLRNLLDGDVKSFASFCPDDGLTVVERSREPDLRHSVSTELLLKPHTDSAPGTCSNSVSATYWVDQVEYFDKSEIAGNEFKRIFEEFHAIMLETYGDFVSMGMWDEWHDRFLGPAISAKVCAGTYVYFYFVKERRGWKVWRMEWACH